MHAHKHELRTQRGEREEQRGDGRGEAACIQALPLVLARAAGRSLACGPCTRCHPRRRARSCARLAPPGLIAVHLHMTHCYIIV